MKTKNGFYRSAGLINQTPTMNQAPTITIRKKGKIAEQFYILLRMNVYILLHNVQFLEP
jgi:hypothetical protein